ncbi:methyl-accepting chemotaxis protein [Niveispirillum irakense]|uniref:methyl-accepting chemotaxis protein n=1 Tax=Niveispirillum irakense TaxID=34011 RepID=UPI0003F9836B|nr:methyl-accepting chemotaxis protein [Niveispirillum irakense]
MIGLLRSSLKTRLVLSGIGLCIVLGASLTAASAFLTYRSTKADVTQTLQEGTENYALIAANTVERALRNVALVTATAEGGLGDPGFSRPLLINQATRLVAAAPGIVGVTIAFEPDALDGLDAASVGTPGADEKGRFAPYFFNKSDGTVGIEALVMTVEAGIQQWYLDPLQQNRSLLTPPYIYPVEGKDVLMVTASAPIRRDGKAVGIATTDLALTDLQQQFASMHPLGAGDVRLLAQNNHWVVHPQAAELNRPVEAPGLMALINSASPGQPAMDTLELEGQERLVLAYPIRFAGVPEQWTLLVTLPTQVITDAVTQTLTPMIVIALVLTVLAAAAFYGLGNGVANPILRLTGTMRAIARGDLKADIPHLDHHDEIGHMAEALRDMRDGLKAAEQLRAENAQREAAMSEQRRMERQSLAAQFEQEVGSLLSRMSGAAASLVDQSNMMSQDCADTQQSAALGAAAVTEAAANVQTVAAAAEQLRASIAEIGTQVQMSAGIAARAAEEAGAATGTVDLLTQSADRIGNVVGLISEIASQTNLLALNATIEAARAGEAGKGFAVVAAEVKNLATQTAKATEEIADLVGSIRQTSAHAATAIGGIAGTIRTINETATAIAGAVEEQTAATQEIARNVDEAARGTDDASRAIQGIAEKVMMVTEAAAMALDSAADVRDRAKEADNEVEAFVGRIRVG